MLSKNQSKLLRSLQRKKIRQQEGLFLVEGGKAVRELLAGNWPLHSLYVSQKFAADVAIPAGIQPVVCTPEALAAAGSLVTNRDAIAVAKILPEAAPQQQSGEWTLALDGINDPGNLGTLIRIADWYGIRQLVCSPDTVDVYNPKVIAASMGSFLRVRTYYRPLGDWLDNLQNVPVLGAYLEGTSVHQLPPISSGGVLLMGSESHGISAELAERISCRVTIPSFGGAESLNVAMATAVLCDNLARINGFTAL